MLCPRVSQLKSFEIQKLGEGFGKNHIIMTCTYGTNNKSVQWSLLVGEACAPTSFRITPKLCSAHELCDCSTRPFYFMPFAALRNERFLLNSTGGGKNEHSGVVVVAPCNLCRDLQESMIQAIKVSTLVDFFVCFCIFLLFWVLFFLWKVHAHAA